MRWSLLLGALIITPVLVQAREVVIIGDSLSCGGFGPPLVTAVAQTGDHVTMYCAVSSKASDWLNGHNPRGQLCYTWTSDQPKRHLCAGTGKIPKLESIQAGRPRAEFILALGTNSMGSGFADVSYQKIASLLTSNGSGCEWIGPPNVRPDQTNRKVFRPEQVAADEARLNDFYTSLKQQVGEHCGFIDSRPCTKRGIPGGETLDGVHRNEAAGEYWVSQIRAQLSKDLQPGVNSQSKMATGAH